MKNEVITLHNIYRRLVRKEEGMTRSEVHKDFMLGWSSVGARRGQYSGINTCTCCNEKYFLTQSRIAVDNDHWSSSAYSTFCTQCVADSIGWQAEKQFMNARIEKDDRWLLTPKGSAALAAEPETLAIID